MKGSVTGDIIGSAYEWNRVKHKDFELFTQGTDYTDDSVLTIAVAEAILEGKDYEETIRRYGLAYPGRGYGGMFKRWLHSDRPSPYGSFGNGSAMRVSPVGFAFDSLEEVLREAEKTAVCTHNHPEGVKGAQAVALAVFLARKGGSKKEIKDEISRSFGYNLNRSLDKIRPAYNFDETCQRTVPEAIIAFLESTDFVDAIRNAVSLGGDSDTLACITGGIAEAFYGEVPHDLEKKAMAYLPDDLRNVLVLFSEAYK